MKVTRSSDRRWRFLHGLANNPHGSVGFDRDAEPLKTLDITREHRLINDIGSGPNDYVTISNRAAPGLEFAR